MRFPSSKEDKKRIKDAEKIGNLLCRSDRMAVLAVISHLINVGLDETCLKAKEATQ